MVGSPIVLVNRTDEVLKFVADGVHFELTPGDNYGYVQPHGYYAMAQNPMMGSEDYYTLAFKSKVGIKGQTDCEPISTEELIGSIDNIERFDRSSADLAPIRVVKPNHRMPKGRTGEISNGASGESFAVGG